MSTSVHRAMHAVPARFVATSTEDTSAAVHLDTRENLVSAATTTMNAPVLPADVGHFARTAPVLIVAYVHLDMKEIRMLRVLVSYLESPQYIVL